MDKHNATYIVFLTLGILLCTPYLSATVNYANSCNASDVQATINESNTGDVVVIPPGTCTWATQILMNKEITLRGSGTDSTIILNSYPQNYSGLVNIVIDPDTSTMSRVTEITFRSDNTVTEMQRHIQIDGDKNYRIDHCRFEDGYANLSKTIYITGYQTWGVIDNCTFDGDALEMIGVLATNQLWEEDSTLGTNQATYIEDSLFINSYGGHALTAIGGAKTVFRHNRIYGTDIDMHGHCFVDGRQSARHYEIYENDIYHYNTGWHFGMFLRGGTGVVFNNRLWEGAPGGGFHGEIALTDYRATRSCPHDACGGSPIGEGYPLYDQIGRGKNQTSEPLYIWNNRLDSNSDGILDRDAIVSVNSVDDPEDYCGDYGADHYIQNIPHDGGSNPDYYDDGTSLAGYIPYTYPHPLTQLTCSQQGGTCCASTQTCTGGLVIESTDGCIGRCCLAGTCAGASTCDDADSDGYGLPGNASCTYPDEDCNDTNNHIYPLAHEACNNIDDNCDGKTDESWPSKGQPCTKGTGICLTTSQLTCSLDGSSLFCNAITGTPTIEICTNHLDDDCDGYTDTEDSDCTTNKADNSKPVSLTSGCSCNTQSQASSLIFTMLLALIIVARKHTI